MLKSLELHNYRNLNLRVELDATANLIIAANGQGKSNLLESIYYTVTGKSFRPIQNVTEVIGPATEFAKVSISLSDNEIEYVTSFDKRLVRKLIIDQKQRTHKQLRKSLQVIVFAPHDVNLVGGEPAVRREDLDVFLGFYIDGYNELALKYRKLVSNRNALLKQVRNLKASREELSYWTEQVIEFGSQIHEHRRQILTDITPMLSMVSEQLYKPFYADFHVDYQPSPSVSANFRQTLSRKFEGNLEKEIAVGQTLYGPHKDDYDFIVSEKPLRFFGSRGEQRLAVLIWKIAMLKLLQESQDASLIMLIDDPMSELDAEHRQLCAEYLLQSGIQFILTAAETADVPEVLRKQAHKISLWCHYCLPAFSGSLTPAWRSQEVHVILSLTKHD